MALFCHEFSTLLWYDFIGGLPAERRLLEQSFETLSHFGRSIFLSRNSVMRVFKVKVMENDLGLNAIAGYLHRHWSVDFLPDLEHKQIIGIGKMGNRTLANPAA